MQKLSCFQLLGNQQTSKPETSKPSSSFVLFLLLHLRRRRSWLVSLLLLRSSSSRSGGAFGSGCGRGTFCRSSDLAFGWCRCRRGDLFLGARLLDGDDNRVDGLLDAHSLRDLQRGNRDGIME